MYISSKESLLRDLYEAYKDAIKHKKNKSYVKEFGKDLDMNILRLRNELIHGTYEPSKSMCFIINYPKKREVFAAHFRDRIVHHLYFNYTYKLFESTFIADSYSCIEEKGTHFGIERCRKHILEESVNYTKECYCLKMDIKGYFMHIDRNRLNEIIKEDLLKMSEHRINKSKNVVWSDVIDYNLIFYLTDIISLYNPIENCVFISNPDEWEGLSKDKSLFYVEEGCGLPIGNLTSQLYSNVYLNRLDQFVKRELKCKHYGRYVDDFYIISTDKAFLHEVSKKIERFLKEELHLECNKVKTRITNVKYGVEFLGAYIKKNRTYISNQSLKRIKKKIYDYDRANWENTTVINSVNSYLGILAHYSSFKIRKQIFDSLKNLSKYGRFNESYTKFIPYEEE